MSVPGMRRSHHRDVWPGRYAARAECEARPNPVEELGLWRYRLPEANRRD